MSETLDIQETPETAERPFLVRTYDADVAVEGRTVDVRIVPFREVARVADPPDWQPYNEEWMAGCFDHQLKAANRIHANYEHERGVQNVVGHAISLRAESDGYHASFKIHETQAGETTLELIRGGALPGVSLEARPVRSTRTRDGVVQRVKANLRGMAFAREGAFSGAQVLAVRTPPEVILDAALLPVEMDEETVALCRRLGIALPQRYSAQPDVTGTPASSGTPEDGTRPIGDPTSEELGHEQHASE